MKGLMVSLIIVIVAGVSSSVSAAGLQVGEDAAEFRPRLGLQPLGALERPGPDDSEDEVHWPAPTSLLSRNSTTTSNAFSDRQSGSHHPAPAEAAQQGIIFEVKIDDNAVNKLRQGLMVFSPVDVRDRTNRSLSPEVVKEIALFRNANEDKENMNGVRLEPEPIEPGSRTLRFEIDENQLNRIEQDAFVYSVPDQLRGQFNRVEFVKAGGPVGSPGFSNGASRFNTDPSSRFRSTSDPSKFAEQWNSPQPGPNFEPGGSEFIGPVIEKSEIEARRNRVAPLDSNLNYGQRNELPQRQNDRPTLSTSDRFQLPRRESTVQLKQSPFGLARGPEENQNAFDRQNMSNNQRLGSTLAEQQLAALQQQLAIEKAERERLARSVSEWQGEAGRLAQQRDSFSDQLREASSRPVVQQAVANRSTGYREENPGYWDRGLDFAGNAARPYGTRREDFQTQAAVPVAFTQVESDQRDLQAKYERLLKTHGALEQRHLGLEDRLRQQQGQGTRRGGPAENEVQPISYNSDRIRVANADNKFGRNPQADRAEVERGAAPDRSIDNRNAELDEGADSGNSGGASDLLWLIPLLLASVGLNIFLWIHCRTLDLRYSDLADELRDMVGASTVV